MIRETPETRESSRGRSLHEHQPALREMARRLTRSEHDAEDAIQDVWVECLTRPRRRILHLPRYLRVAVKHAALRGVKRERSRHRREEIAARPESQPSFVETLDRLALQESIREEVAALRSPYREVVRMRCLEELSTGEVARRLERPQATVRIQLKRGLDQLRERLHHVEEFAEYRPTGTMGAWMAFLFGGIGSWKRRGAGVRPGVFLGRLVLASVGVAAVVLGTAFLTERTVRGSEPEIAGASFSAPVGEVSLSDLAVERRAVERPEVREPFAPPLSVATGFTLEGTVWDRHGRPVAGAEIWVCPTDDPDSRRSAGRSGEAGDYRITTAMDRVCVWAERDGLAPTRKLVVDLDEPEAVSKDLHFRAVAGKILGRVTDPGGSPVVGARVRVDARFEVEARQGLLGRVEEQSADGRAHTDAHGRFEVTKQRVTRHRVLVVAEGHPPYMSYVSSDLAQDVTLEVVLPEPAGLLGRVLDPQGEPLADLQLSVQSSHGSHRVEGRTESDGTFWIRGLPPGPFLLRGARPIVLGGLAVQVEGSLSEGEGKNLGTLVLGDDSSIWGFALDGSTGKPLEGWSIYLEEERYERSRRRADREVRETSTAVDGSFRFPGCLRGRYKLRLFRPGCGSWGAQASLVGVTPGGGPVRLVRTAETLPTAQVQGVLSSELMEMQPRLRIRGDAFREPFELAVDPETRAFSIGPLTPGDYSLEVEILEYGTWDAARLELEPGDRRDLGTLPFVETGGLDVSLGCAGPRCHEEVSLRLTGPHIDFYTFGHEPVHGVEKNLAGGSIRFPHLLPGDYVLQVRSACHAEEGLSVTVSEYETTEIEIPAVDSAILRFSIAAPRALHRSEEVSVVLSREGYRERIFEPIVRDDRESLMRFSRALPPGEHRIEVRTSSGLAGQLSFDPALMQPRTSHVIELYPE